MYNLNAIASNREAFTQLVAKWFMTKPEKWVFNQEARKFVRKIFTDPKKVRARAEKFVSKLLKETDEDDIVNDMAPIKSSF